MAVQPPAHVLRNMCILFICMHSNNTADALKNLYIWCRNIGTLVSGVFKESHSHQKRGRRNEKCVERKIEHGKKASTTAMFSPLSEKWGSDPERSKLQSNFVQQRANRMSQKGEQWLEETEGRTWKFKKESTYLLLRELNKSRDA